MVTNLQRFTLHYTSWQVMQRDSGMLIVVGDVHLYFVKRTMSESIAMLSTSLNNQL